MPKHPEVRVYESGGLFGWMLVGLDNTIHATSPRMRDNREAALHDARVAMAIMAQSLSPDVPNSSPRRFFRGLPKGRK